MVNSKLSVLADSAGDFAESACAALGRIKAIPFVLGYPVFPL
jgi:hypothetical protein